MKDNVKNTEYILTNSPKGMWQLYKATTYDVFGEDVTTLRFQKNVSKDLQWAKENYPDARVIRDLKSNPNLIQDHHTTMSDEQVIARQKRLNRI